MATQTFKDSYGVLQRHAQTLRNQQEPNIDDLLGIVTESVAAYKVCQERIDAVEKALEKALGDPAVASADSAPPSKQVSSPTSSTPPPAMTGPDEDDIPF